MLSASLCRLASSIPGRVSGLNSHQFLVQCQNGGKSLFKFKVQVSSPTIRCFKTNAILKGQEGERHFVRRAKERMGIKEQLTAPSQGTAFGLGQGAVAGAAVFGLGALCFYGLGYGSETGAIDHSIVWPDYVKQRIRATYEYFGAGLGITAATAVMAFRSPAIMNIMMKNSFLVIGASIAAMIGSGMIARSIPYQPGFGSKQLAFLAHCGVVGIVIAPLCILGGPILTRAAWYTAGICGGLSAVAACAPSEKFLNMGGPLAIGFGVVFASSLGTMFLPPTSVLGAGIWSIALYGGLLLFSGFMLYDTQKIIRVAESAPYGNGPNSYDPVNMSMGIYLDTINIFIRLAQIFAMSQGGGKRK